MGVPLSRRWFPFRFFVALLVIALIIHTSSRDNRNAEASTLQRMGRRLTSPFHHTVVTTATEPATVTATVVATETSMPKLKPTYKPGVPDIKHDYQMALVVSSMKAENVSWIADKLPHIDAYIYRNDDPEAEYTVPQNKGYEVMPYLTFIIDHYGKLPEIMVFVHAHERTHHNPKLLDISMVELVKHLNPHRVIREGYMNMNCGNWESGHCTAQVRPAESKPYADHAKAWQELLPEYPVPAVLAQFCCAQFAVSRERVLQIPLARYKQLRQWVLDTDMQSTMVGYVFEYLWQFLFKGEHVYCPASHACYCDGFGLCFGGPKEFAAYIRLELGKERLLQEIDSIREVEREGKKKDDKFKLPDYEWDRRERMHGVIGDFDKGMERLRKGALERGKDPKLRALEDWLD